MILSNYNIFNVRISLFLHHENFTKTYKIYAYNIGATFVMWIIFFNEKSHKNQYDIKTKSGII